MSWHLSSRRKSFFSQWVTSQASIINRTLRLCELWGPYIQRWETSAPSEASTYVAATGTASFTAAADTSPGPGLSWTSTLRCQVSGSAQTGLMGPSTLKGINCHFGSQTPLSALQAVLLEQRLFLNFDHFMMFQIKAAIDMTTHLIVWLAWSPWKNILIWSFNLSSKDSWFKKQFFDHLIKSECKSVVPLKSGFLIKLSSVSTSFHWIQAEELTEAVAPLCGVLQPWPLSLWDVS